MAQFDKDTNTPPVSQRSELATLVSMHPELYNTDMAFQATWARKDLLELTVVFVDGNINTYAGCWLWCWRCAETGTEV